MEISGYVHGWPLLVIQKGGHPEDEEDEED
jgi:hypothetical protein